MVGRGNRDATFQTVRGVEVSMAFNPSPAVAEARDIADKHGDDMVIVVRIHLENGIQTASYGRTKALCNLAGRLADVYHDQIEEILEKVEARLAEK